MLALKNSTVSKLHRNEMSQDVWRHASLPTPLIDKLRKQSNTFGTNALSWKNYWFLGNLFQGIPKWYTFQHGLEVLQFMITVEKKSAFDVFVYTLKNRNTILFFLEHIFAVKSRFSLNVWIKGVSFVRNCDAASVGEYNKVIWYYQLSW